MKSDIRPLSCQRTHYRNPERQKRQNRFKLSSFIIIYITNVITSYFRLCHRYSILCTISIKNSDLDLKRQMRKMYANANVLLRKFSKCSINVKCYLFKTYCSNLYCAPMWFDCTKTALKKLKVAYNNSLRRFMGLPWHNSASEMFVNLNIKSFGEMLRSFVYSFRSRIMISGNLMLIGIYHSPCIIYSNLWAWWRTLLFVNL